MNSVLYRLLMPLVRVWMACSDEVHTERRKAEFAIQKAWLEDRHARYLDAIKNAPLPPVE